MSNEVVVHKNRTNKVTVDLGMNVAVDTFTAQIRTEPDHTSTLLATWTVAFLTDGIDGKILLTLDDSVTSGITAKTGYMDLRRVTAGEPVSVFDYPLKVEFRGTVTA